MTGIQPKLLMEQKSLTWRQALPSGVTRPEPQCFTSLLAQLSPEVRDLLDHILVPKEEERITIPEIEAHPWCAPFSGLSVPLGMHQS